MLVNPSDVSYKHMTANHGARETRGVAPERRMAMDEPPIIIIIVNSCSTP